MLPLAADLGDQAERESLAGRDGEKHCAVSNEWIANRFGMGHTGNVSRLMNKEQLMNPSKTMQSAPRHTLDMPPEMLKAENHEN